MAKIAFYDAKAYDKESFNKINEKYGYEIEYFDIHLDKTSAALAKGADIVCAFVNDAINKDVIAALKEEGISLIALRSAGYNNVDLKAAYKNIHVVRVPAYSPYAVAEHAAALMLSLNRKIHKAYVRTRESNFNIAGLKGFDMKGKCAGVVGTGKIGRVMISILKGFGMDILAYDPYPNEEYEKEEGFKYVSLDEIYKQSDIISLHCPLTKESYHMINGESISKMKEGVMLINTSRGQLVDSQALIEGLKNRKISSAGLDVYEEESEYFFEDFSDEVIADDVLARLLSFHNVLISSHQAFLTKEALENIAQTTLENVKSFLNGDALDNEICYGCENGCRKKEKGRCF